MIAISPRRSVVLFVLTFAVAGCQDVLSEVPNMDYGSSGCANTRGPAMVPRLPTAAELKGKTPAQAGAVAAGLGHVVVWNRQTQGYGECWCIPPTVGVATGEVFLGDHNQLFILVDASTVRSSEREQPPAGWGC
jgi:hypothetical protein